MSTQLSDSRCGTPQFLEGVKAEVMSIYRKLGVSSRSQAVGRARELALLDT